MIKSKNIITPTQRNFLLDFSKIEDAKNFFFTGGTALSEFYLGHRLSFDVDFFTTSESLLFPFFQKFSRKFSELDWSIKVTQRFNSLIEGEAKLGGESIRFDIAFSSQPRLAELEFAKEYGIYVNSYSDLIAEKTIAFWGRSDPRDAIDLFFILKQENIKALFHLAKKKDPGFDLYGFAVALKRADAYPLTVKELPVKMLKEIDMKELKALFQNTAIYIMAHGTEFIKDE